MIKVGGTKFVSGSDLPKSDHIDAQIVNELTDQLATSKQNPSPQAGNGTQKESGVVQEPHDGFGHDISNILFIVLIATVLVVVIKNWLNKK